MLQHTCYKPGMPKPASLKPKKIEPLPMKVSGEIKDALAIIAERYDRPLGYVARELMLRGLAAFRRDGQLKDSARQDVDLSAAEEVIQVPAMSERLNDDITMKRAEIASKQRSHKTPKGKAEKGRSQKRTRGGK